MQSGNLVYESYYILRVEKKRKKEKCMRREGIEFTAQFIVSFFLFLALFRSGSCK